MHTPTPPLSTLLRERNAESWQRALGMRFVREATDDTLDDTVFARYLLFEREFVDTAARLAGAAVRDAPSSRALTGHATTLHHLVTEQYDYFTEALEAVGTVLDVGEDAQEQASVLTETVLDTADRLGYPGILAGMFAAESLYGTWCAAAARTPSARPVLANWIDLHVRAPFTGQLRFLTEEIDALEILPETVEDLVAVFGQTLEAEIRFHDAAYSD